MLIPTAIDPTMAPPGKHMMTVFVQYAPYALASGEPWDGPARDALAETVIAKIARHSPDFRDLIDRKSVVSGKSVSVRVDLGGRRIIKKQKYKKQITQQYH